MEVKTIVIEKQIFVSNDGKEFDTEAACLKHERDRADAVLKKEYADTLREMQRLKRRGDEFPAFSLSRLNDRLMHARSEYVNACRNGISGTLADRLECMSTICRRYADAIRQVDNAREMYKLQRQRLDEIGEKLGYLVPTCRKMRERSLAALSCKNSGTDVK